MAESVERKLITNPLHDVVYGRRVKVLARHMAEMLPPNARVLDVGTGDGLILKLIVQQRPDVTFEGIDIMLRPHTHVPVREFDGKHFPADDDSYDGVTFMDVLHHTPDPEALVREAARVARSFVLIKDHARDGLLANRTLAFMDWVGNARHGVVLPYNYWSRAEWEPMFTRVGLNQTERRGELGLYPLWGSWLFDRQLHFITRLEHAK